MPRAWRISRWCLSGITTVGEFHYVHHAPGGAPYEDRNLLAWQVLRAAEETGLRICSVAHGLRARRLGQAGRSGPGPVSDAARGGFHRRYGGLARRSRGSASWSSAGCCAAQRTRGSARLSLRVASYARANRLPLHMHVAEQPAEVEACLGEYGLRPVELLHQNGILDSRFTGIHAIHITAEEALFGRARKRAYAPVPRPSGIWAMAPCPRIDCSKPAPESVSDPTATYRSICWRMHGCWNITCA
jgi:formimidoylglutamate deiminase